MIRIEAKFNAGDVMKAVQGKTEIIREIILNELKFIGLEFVRNARINADFTDRTGNLRSSIGYIIFKDGEPIDIDFELSDNGTEKSQGVSTGKALAQKIARDFDVTGYLLVVVAGMQYAVFVEAKGFDVITSSSFKAEQELKELGNNIKKLIK